MQKLFIISLLLTLFLYGCATPESEFAKAKDETDYRLFYQHYPNHPLAKKAREREQELNAEEAIRINRSDYYEYFLDKFPNSIYKIKVINAYDALLDEELHKVISKNDFDLIKKVEAQAEKYGLLRTSNDAKKEISTFILSKVPSTGRILWESKKEVSRHYEVNLIEISCAATASDDESKQLFNSSYFARKVNGIQKTMYLGTIRASFNHFKETYKLLEPDISLYLYPQQENDSISLSRGKLRIYAGVGTSDDKHSVDVKFLRRYSDKHRTFQILDKTKGEIIPNISLIIRLQIPKGQNQDDFLKISGFGSVTVIKSNGSFRNGICSIEPTNAIIIGTVRLPESNWVSLKPNLAARSGAIKFEENRVFLTSGTEIRYKEK